MKAQKKPIVIDYLPCTGFSFTHISDITGWMNSLGDSFSTWFDYYPLREELYVKTLEGTSYEVTTDDVIIRGVNHEYYPCKVEIFNKTYDLL